MGVKYAEGVILDVEKTWHESKIRVPLVCLLSMGSDPTMTIDGLSKKHQIGKHYITLVYVLLIMLTLLNRMPYNLYGSRTGGSC